jgi:outer membrane protein assembly factor BamB
MTAQKTTRASCPHIPAFILLCAIAIAGCDTRSDPNPNSLSQRSSPVAGQSQSLVWDWNENRTWLNYCIQEQLKGFEVELKYPVEREFARVNLRIERDGKEVFSYAAHDHTVFERIGDTIYVAEFSPIATGCKLIAYNLKDKKQLWNTTLQGLGEIDHSKYMNRVMLQEVDGDIVVFGNESQGRYIERVDAVSGKTKENTRLSALSHGSGSPLTK